MRPILKNTAPGSDKPGGGQDKARGALNSTKIIPYSNSKYNLTDLLAVATNSYTTEDINRVKNAVISYCLAMAEGDTTTMTTAADMLQRLADQPMAIRARHNEYAHIHNGGRL